MNLVKRTISPVRSRNKFNRPVWGFADDIFNSMLQPDWFDFSIPSLMKGDKPSLNMVDRGNHYNISIDAPGFDDNDIDVSIDGDQLTVRGSYNNSTEEEEGNYLIYEKKAGSFVRTVTLPREADKDSINAYLSKGVLNIDVNKLNDTSSPKKIKVKSL